MAERIPKTIQRIIKQQRVRTAAIRKAQPDATLKRIAERMVRRRAQSY